MDISERLTSASTAVAALGECIDELWFIDDVYQRVLFGDIEDMDDAVELLVEGLDDDVDALPDVTRQVVDEDIDAVASQLADIVWSAAASRAAAWADEVTDVDRIEMAFDRLSDDHGIDLLIFADHASVEDRPGQRGAGVIWVNAWEEFDADNPVAVSISAVSRDQSVGDAEVARQVAEVLIAEGIEVLGVGEQDVEIRALWRHHVGEREVPEVTS